MADERPDIKDTAEQAEFSDPARNELKEKAKSMLAELKKQKRRLLTKRIISAVMIAACAVIATFGQYRRYSEVKVYEKPQQIDEGQQTIPNDGEKIPDESTASAPSEGGDSTADTPESKTDDSFDGHFTIYSVGDVLTAENGSGAASCDIRNTADSDHDIVASFYIDSEVLKDLGIDTSSLEEDKWLIGQSGLFEPGFRITSVQLKELPDGSYLPAGTYNISMIERFYDHKTGALSSYETGIPMTLEVQS
ncbi:MAG: hypothetical protein J6M17_00765 [Ruminococcus sp.]|nr:hypothetical protein [Ruminococcus sp.]